MRANPARRRCGASRGASATPSTRASWRILRRRRAAPLDKEEPRTLTGVVRRIQLLSTWVNRLQGAASPKIHHPFIALCSPSGRELYTARQRKPEVLSNVVDWPLWSRGDLLLVSFYQLPIPELGSGSYERHQMMSV